jgi:hypothetical protein
MRRKNWLKYWVVLGGMSLLALACSGMGPEIVEPAEAAAIEQEQEVEDVQNQQEPPEAVNPTAEEQVTEEPVVDENPFEGINPRFNPNLWPETDFTKHSVDYDEILSGGPPPDGIPSIDAPIFETIDQADSWLGDDWPVMFFEYNDTVRAYPLAILIWHEIVNDVVGGKAVAITFCPLCNSTIVFDRNLADGTLLEFGTTGNLRNSDLVMYDRQTKSWWQQFTGEAIVGELTGTNLVMLSSQLISWADFKANHPNGEVLSRETGQRRSYGTNPYGGYDSIGNDRPFLYDGDPDERLHAVERVVAVQIGDQFVAYPFSSLAEELVVNDEVAGEKVVVFWKSGTRTAFGNSDQDTGSSAVFNREINGQTLTFEPASGDFVDIETGTRWNLFGLGIDGPLAGNQLEQLISAEHFWFSWAVFRPETIIWTP